MSLRYLYCAVPASPRIDLSSFAGEGAPLEQVEASGVGGVVGAVDEDRYGEPAMAAAFADVKLIAPYAVAHQAVVQHVFERAPAVVPLAFGSVHRSSADAARALGREAPRLRTLLAELDGRQEWGLRVVWRAPQVSVSHGPGAGTDYLKAKAASLRATKPTAEALAVADELARVLAEGSERSRDLERNEGDLVVRGAYLVARDRAAALREAFLARADELERQGLVAELSGPWPAYSFIPEAARS